MAPDAPAPADSPAPPVRPLASRLRAYRLLWILALAVFGSDQLSKWWIVETLPFGTGGWHAPGQYDLEWKHGGFEIVPGFFYITHVGNTGAAWSMFSGRSGWLAILAAGTLFAIYCWRHHLGLRERIVQLCFGLLCGGIVGNLVDRLQHGHVIDFLDFHFGSYIYPTFNIADSGICVGVVIYLIHSLRTPKEPGQNPKS